MHPEIRQQLAAAHVSEMIAQAERWHLARQARLARRSRTPRPTPPPGPPPTQADTERPAASAVPAGAGPAR
jgi:hypothetical protein